MGSTKQYKKLIAVFITSAIYAGTAQSAQRCKEYKPATAPTDSFEIDLEKNVVIKDGLMWKRCAEGQSLSSRKGCKGKANLIYFEDALTNSKYKRFAGYSDWRVPTIEELASVVEKRCKQPAFNLQVFPEAPNLKIWSSSVVENNDEKVWIMFSSTGVKIKHRASLPAMLRMVRDVK